MAAGVRTLLPNQVHTLRPSMVGFLCDIFLIVAYGVQYAGKENPGLESGIDTQVLGILSLIERKYHSSETSFQPMDFARAAQFFTLDVITTISYGYAFGYLANDEDIHGYIEITEKMVPFLNLCSTIPVVEWVFRSGWVRNSIGPGAGDANGVGKLMG